MTKDQQWQATSNPKLTMSDDPQPMKEMFKNTEIQQKLSKAFSAY